MRWGESTFSEKVGGEPLVLGAYLSIYSLIIGFIYIMGQANCRVHNDDYRPLVVEAYSALDTFSIIPFKRITLAPDEEKWLHALPDIRGIKIRLNYHGCDSILMKRLDWKGPGWTDWSPEELSKVHAFSNGTSIRVRRELLTEGWSSRRRTR
jgi:hypothetical protein